MPQGLFLFIYIFISSGKELRDLDSKSCPKALPRFARNSGAWFLYKVRTKINFGYQKTSKIAHAAGLGFEPRYQPSKGCVLPLDDPAMFIVLK